MRLRLLPLSLSLDTGCGINCLLNSFVQRLVLLVVVPLNEMSTLLWVVARFVGFLMVSHRVSCTYQNMYYVTYQVSGANQIFDAISENFNVRI